MSDICYYMKLINKEIETMNIPFSSKKLVKYVDMAKLKEYIRNETDAKVLTKLIFISNLYEGFNIQESAEKLGYDKRTGQRWLNKWNENEKEGLKTEWSKGRPSKLSEEQLEELKKTVIKDQINTTPQIKHLILEKWDINYSSSQVTRILRKLGLKYSKPYTIYSKEPKNAEKILIERVQEVKNEIPDNLKDNIVFVFMDEASFQNKDNSQRIWHDGNNKIVKSQNKNRVNTIIWYASNGESHLEFLENSKKESITASLFEFVKKTKKNKL